MDLDALKLKYKEMGEEIEKLEQAKKNFDSWPKPGDAYWGLSAVGVIREYTYNNDHLDKVAKKLGMFRSMNDASAELGSRQVVGELKLQPGCRKFVTGKKNYSFSINLKDNNLSYNFWIHEVSGWQDVYFDTLDNARWAVYDVGVPRILASARWLATGTFNVQGTLNDKMD